MSNNDKEQQLSDVLDDVKRLQDEKMKFFERTIELERELAEAKEQLATIVEGRGSDEVAPEHYSEVGRRNWRIGQLLSKLEALRSAMTPTQADYTTLIEIAERYEMPSGESLSAEQAVVDFVHDPDVAAIFMRNRYVISSSKDGE